MNAKEIAEHIRTLREVSALLGMPESTLRLYRDEFEEYVPCVGQGRKRRYTSEGVDALRRIVEWKRGGWSAGQIRDTLARERTPRERVRRRTAEERLDEVIGLLTAQAGEIAMLRAEVSALRASVAEVSAASRVHEAPHLEDVLAAALARDASA